MCCFSNTLPLFIWCHRSYPRSLHLIRYYVFTQSVGWVKYTAISRWDFNLLNCVTFQWWLASTWSTSYSCNVITSCAFCILLAFATSSKSQRHSKSPLHSIILTINQNSVWWTLFIAQFQWSCVHWNILLWLLVHGVINSWCFEECSFPYHSCHSLVELWCCEHVVLLLHLSYLLHYSLWHMHIDYHSAYEIIKHPSLALKTILK